jgi:REP element-mobilizing transposase RayT
MTERPKRKPNRLSGYDYSQSGAYFVTICTKNRAELFGSVIAGSPVPCRPLTAGRNYVELNEIGNVVETAITHNNRDGIVIDHYIVMPNHIHMLVIIGETGDRGRSPLHMLIRNMKAYVTKKIGFSPWQKSFHDHIIRNENDYIRIAEYIESNPITWEQDCFHPTKNDMSKIKG